VEKLMPFDEKITINLQKLVDICLHELPTNLQNSMQNDLVIFVIACLNVQ